MDSSHCSDLCGRQAAADPQQARAAELPPSEFLAYVSHEIRTPLNAILGYADSLLDPRQTEAERRVAIETIQRNATHAAEIVNDILDLSKINSGTFAVARSRCSPARILADVLDTLRLPAAAKGLTLQQQWETPIPATIVSDPLRLKQILINLVGNAIKFTERGSVTVTLRLVDGPPNAADLARQLEFAVSDTGIGMSDEHLQRAFNPFQQADARIARRFGGTGLGLAISRRLAQMLDGDICVESRLGRGSTFNVRIATGPLEGVMSLEAPADAHASELCGPPTRTAKPLVARVLLAEDGPDNQRVIAHLLRKAGATVDVVDNGSLAVDHAVAATGRGEPYDVVLMDMMMPDMDGCKAASQLRERGCLDPIIALTAASDDSERVRCLAAGCDDFATKPIDRATLIGLVRKWTDQRESPVAVPLTGNVQSGACTRETV